MCPESGRLNRLELERPSYFTSKPHKMSKTLRDFILAIKFRKPFRTVVRHLRLVPQYLTTGFSPIATHFLSASWGYAKILNLHGPCGPAAVVLVPCLCWTSNLSWLVASEITTNLTDLNQWRSSISSSSNGVLVLGDKLTAHIPR